MNSGCNWKRPNGELPWELPLDKPIIHPTMPVLLCDNLVQLCEDINMSVWDRDKVYEALAQVQVQPRRE